MKISTVMTALITIPDRSLSVSSLWDEAGNPQYLINYIDTMSGNVQIAKIDSHKLVEKLINEFVSDDAPPFDGALHSFFQV